MLIIKQNSKVLATFESVKKEKMYIEKYCMMFGNFIGLHKSQLNLEMNSSMPE